MKQRTILRIQLWASLATSIGLAVIIGHEYVRPWIAVKSYGEEYKRLAFDCDMAMHEEAALRQQPSDNPESQASHSSNRVGL